MTLMDDQHERPPSAPGAAAVPPQGAAHSPEHDALLREAADPALTEDRALALLERADLAADTIEQLAKNRSILKLRKIKIALACHPRAPRRVSMPLIRQFYTFDLMKVALSPAVPGDVKLRADETLIARLKTTAQGERSTLARRASGNVAGALLLDEEERIMRTALENGRLTEAHVVQAVAKPEAGAALVQAVSRHEKWSRRHEIQLALLRTGHLSLAKALAFTRDMSHKHLTEILQTSRLPEKIKDHLQRDLQNKEPAP